MFNVLLMSESTVDVGFSWKGIGHWRADSDSMFHVSFGAFAFWVVTYLLSSLFALLSSLFSSSYCTPGYDVGSRHVGLVKVLPCVSSWSCSSMTHETTENGSRSEATKTSS